jgi:hypothetical protein
VINKGKKYRTFVLPDFLEFRKLADGMGAKWTLRYSAKDGLCYSWDQPPPPGISYNLVKVFAVFPDVPPDVMYDVLHDAPYRKEWDEGMIKGYNICQLTPTNDIGYYGVKCPSPITNRDFCNQRAWIQTTNNEYIILNTSVEHVDQPKVSGFIRAFSYISGYFIRSSGKGCSMTYLTQSDPAGWLPAYFMNQGTAKFAPNLMSKLHAAALKYPAWKKKNSPEHRPWLTESVSWPAPVDDITPQWVVNHNKK